MDKRNIKALGMLFVGLCGGFAILAWPHYRAASTIQSKVASVKAEVANQDQDLGTLQELARRVQRLRRHIESTHREIPRHADMAALMTALTVPSDGVEVLEQTFNRGKVRAVHTIEDGSIYALPLVVDMEASFHAVYRMIQKAERIPKLVRVSSVRFERHKDHPNLVNATVTFDAIFEVPVPEDDASEGAI